MKKIKIAALIMALTVLETSAISASAKEFGGTEQDATSTVYANIQGDGNVSYVVEIPDSVDFGTLAQPDTDTDSYDYLSFAVTLKEVSGLESGQKVGVWVKDNNASVGGDEQFYLTQDGEESPFKMTYDIYDADVNDETIAESTSINSGEMGENGYMLATFANADDMLHATLALNLKQLYGQNLNSIAGNYTGTMAFHTEITE